MDYLEIYSWGIVIFFILWLFKENIFIAFFKSLFWPLSAIKLIICFIIWLFVKLRI